MNSDRAVLAFAGLVVLVNIALGYLVSPYWFLLTAFAGLNMLQLSLTGFCPAAIVFRRLGLKRGVGSSERRRTGEFAAGPDQAESPISAGGRRRQATMAAALARSSGQNPTLGAHGMSQIAEFPPSSGRAGTAGIGRTPDFRRRKGAPHLRP